MDALEVSFSKGKAYEQCVRWQIVRATEKAWLVHTPAGDLWVPIWEWNRRVGPAGWPDEATYLRRIIGFLTEISASAGDMVVTIKESAANRSASAKTVKVTFELERSPVDSDRWVATHRTFEAPAALLSKLDDGQMALPRWLLQKKLKDRERLAAGDVWPGIDVMKAQLQQAFDTARSEHKSNALKSTSTVSSTLS